MLRMGNVQGMGLMLTSRGASLQVKLKVYRACMQSVFGYVNETWAMKEEDKARMMFRWVCGVHLKSRMASMEQKYYDEWVFSM